MRGDRVIVYDFFCQGCLFLYGKKFLHGAAMQGGFFAGVNKRIIGTSTRVLDIGVQGGISVLRR